MTSVLHIDEPSAGVMLLSLNRPAQRNAIDLELLDALSAAFACFEKEDQLRAAVLTGTPPAFCAGLDLKTFSAPDAPRHRATALIQSMATLAKPIIAAVGGAAYTGGLEMALGCDFILASTEARFADTHARIGALSGSGMGSRLPHATGTRFAKQMMLSCQPINAETALRAGLVNEVLAPDRLLARAIEVASAIASHDPALIRVVKDVVDRGAHGTLSDALRLEADALALRNASGGMHWSGQAKTAPPTA
ncbi:enoyl-CoA hydratase [Sphingomonas zeicaulis]|uniref:enoyl-CoA hydratase-related protein n=1 Tax=Sphingomonas zeicaulis TaxID=1632740 RepID=UPI003D1DCE15